MSKSTHAAAAAAIRAELKAHGIKGTVTSKSYSMGSSVNVKLTGDVLPATRDAVEAFAARFQYGHFDGMTDSYEYSNRDDSRPQVKFVFVSVDYSDELRAAARAYVEARWNGAGRYDADSLTWQVMNGSYECDFWTARKPRVRA